MLSLMKFAMALTKGRSKKEFVMSKSSFIPKGEKSDKLSQGYKTSTFTRLKVLIFSSRRTSEKTLYVKETV